MMTLHERQTETRKKADALQQQRRELLAQLQQNERELIQLDGVLALVEELLMDEPKAQAEG